MIGSADKKLDRIESRIGVLMASCRQEQRERAAAPFNELGFATATRAGSACPRCVRGSPDAALTARLTARSGTFPGRFRHVMETLLRGGVASTLVTPFSSFVTPSARNIHSVTSFGEDS